VNRKGDETWFLCDDDMKAFGINQVQILKEAAAAFEKIEKLFEKK
jgi:hypothetical protein